MSLVEDLRNVFSGPHPIEPHPWVADFLDADETVVWQGQRQRSGRYSFTRQFVGFGLTLLAIPLITNYMGLSLAPFLAVLEENPSQLVVPLGVIALLFVGAMIRSRKDPGKEWAYAVTDKRLLTFYKGKNVRAAGPEDVERFAVRRGFEARLRGLGDVTWRLGTETAGDQGGPDQGRHGFLAIREPHEVRERLEQWRDLVYAEGDRDDLAFAKPLPAAPADMEGTQIGNRRYGFAITVPAHWSGRMAIRTIRRPKVLGFEMPIPAYHFENEAQLPETSADWNFLELAGPAGVTLELEILEGPLPTTFAAEMAGMEERGERDAVVQSKEVIDQPPFRGFSIAADLTRLKVALDTGVVRRIWLGTDAFHLRIYAKVIHADSGAQSEAMDAMIDSIRPL